MTFLGFSLKNKSAFYAVILMFALVGFATSCRSSRTVVGDGLERDASTELSQKELKKLFTQLNDGYSDWQNVKIPITLTLTKPKNFSINGILTMERDQSIYISLRFFGMEVASLVATADSIFASYKMERIYFAESLDSMLGGFPASIGNVQNLLLGRLFMLGQNSVEMSKCRLDGNGATWTVAPCDSPAGIDYDFTIDTPTGNVELLTVNLPSQSSILIDYSEFAVTQTGAMAGLTSVSTQTSNADFNGEISYNVNKAEWNGSNTKTWSAPKGYKRVLLSDIINSLKQQ